MVIRSLEGLLSPGLCNRGCSEHGLNTRRKSRVLADSNKAAHLCEVH